MNVILLRVAYLRHERNACLFYLAEMIAIAVLSAAVLLYFPSRPPMPPSVAAASQRLSYRSSICRLLR